MQNDQQNIDQAEALRMKLAQDRAALVNDMMQQDMQMPDEAIIANNKMTYLSRKTLTLPSIRLNTRNGTTVW